MLGIDELYSVTDDTPYFPADVLDSRGKRFAVRVGALILLAFMVRLPLFGGQLLWPDAVVMPRGVAPYSWNAFRPTGSFSQLLRHEGLPKTFVFFESVRYRWFR